MSKEQENSSMHWTASAEELLEPLQPRLLRFELVTENPINFAPAAAIVFRSVFGLALKNVSCPNKRDICGTCRHEEGCVYSFAFESPRPSSRRAGESSHAPHPLVIRVLNSRNMHIPKGFVFQVEILALGPLRNEVEAVTEAVAEVGRLGLGQQRGRFLVASSRVLDYDHSRVSALHKGEALRLDHLEDRPPLSTPFPDELGEVSLRFVTPTKIVRHGATVVAIDFESLVRAILRRYMHLCDAYGTSQPDWDTSEILSAAGRINLVKSDMRIRNRERWSSRQKRSIPVSGVTGEATYVGHLSPFDGLLRLGELLHVGKGTIMGQGRYYLQSARRR